MVTFNFFRSSKSQVESIKAKPRTFSDIYPKKPEIRLLTNTSTWFLMQATNGMAEENVIFCLLVEKYKQNPKMSLLNYIYDNFGHLKKYEINLSSDKFKTWKEAVISQNNANDNALKVNGIFNPESNIHDACIKNIDDTLVDIWNRMKNLDFPLGVALKDDESKKRFLVAVDLLQGGDVLLKKV